MEARSHWGQLINWIIEAWRAFFECVELLILAIYDGFEGLNIYRSTHYTDLLLLGFLVEQAFTSDDWVETACDNFV